MLVSLRQHEAEQDKMADDSSELVQMSGEAKISVNVQQITSRFQSIQTTAKVSADVLFPRLVRLALAHRTVFKSVDSL